MTAEGGPEIRPLRPGDPESIGPYRVTGRLGAGGMGAVYAGLDAQDRRVAVKVVHAQYAQDPEFRARFTREVNLLRSIRGTCTTPVLDADVNAETPWFATEYVPGPTLDARIDAGGPMRGDELMGLAAGLAEALVALHDANVVHRDLKPQNIICSPAGPRVLDLGIARSVEDEGLTRTGMMIGSPAWMSPERFRGHESTPAADVYAWAMLITYAASGAIPFGTGAPEVVALRVLQEDADLSAVPDQLRLLVKRAADKEPTYRPAARDLLATVTAIWRGALGNPNGGSLDPVADATSLIGQLWSTPASGGPWQVRPQPAAAPAAPPPREYHAPRGPARSGSTAAFAAPQVAPPPVPPPPGYGPPTHDPYGAGGPAQPHYHSAPGGATYGATAGGSGPHYAPPPPGVPSGGYGVPAGVAPTGPHGTAYPQPQATGMHTIGGTGRTEARVQSARKPRWGVVGGAVAAVVAMAAVIGVVLSTGGDDEKKKPEATGTKSASPKITGKVGPLTHTLSGMTFEVPAKWEVRETGENEVCLLPTDLPEAQRTCERGGLRIWAGKDNRRKVDLDSGTGWTLGEKATCVVDPEDKGAVRGKSSGRGFDKPGVDKGLNYEHGAYEVTCADGKKFKPQVWWLPTSMVSFSTAGLPGGYDDAVDSILASVDVSKYKRPK